MDQAERQDKLKRRGLLAGVAALVAGALGKLAGPQRAEAGHDATNVFHLGLTNAAATTTTLSASGGNLGGALRVTNTDGGGSM